MATAQKNASTPAANSNKPKGSTKPGAKDAKAKKAKVEKVPHPLVGNKDESVYPFVTAPSDFNPKAHQPLSRRDFADDVNWLDYKIGRMEASLAELRSQREDAATLGDKKSRQGKKRLEQLMAKQMEVLNSLKEQGHDVDAIMATARQAAAKKVEEAKTVDKTAG